MPGSINEYVCTRASLCVCMRTCVYTRERECVCVCKSDFSVPACFIVLTLVVLFLSFFSEFSVFFQSLLLFYLVPVTILLFPIHVYSLQLSEYYWAFVSCVVVVSVSAVFIFHLIHSFFSFFSILHETMCICTHVARRFSFVHNSMTYTHLMCTWRLYYNFFSPQFTWLVLCGIGKKVKPNNESHSTKHYFKNDEFRMENFNG